MDSKQDAATALPPIAIDCSLRRPDEIRTATPQFTHFVHHLMHHVNIVESNLSCFLSAESLSSNMVFLHNGPYAYANLLPSSQAYIAQMQRFHRVMEESCTVMAIIYNTILTLDSHQDIVMQARTYHALLDSVLILLPMVAKVQVPPSRELGGDVVRTLVAQ